MSANESNASIRACAFPLFVLQFCPKHEVGCRGTDLDWPGWDNLWMRKGIIHASRNHDDATPHS